MKAPPLRQLNWLKPAVFGIGLWLLAIMPWPTSTAQNPKSKRQLEKEPVQSQKNSQRRIALVIGNGAYQNASRLTNPPNDAEDVAAALRRLGFELVGDSAHVNQSADQMKRLIVDFGEMLSAGGVGLFYYAGHGVQSQGHNYMIPVEANILRERTLEFDAVDVNRALAQMDAAGNGFNIVILDACRNNPFTRSWRDASQGLAQVNAPEGTLIAYSTSPGRVASDGTGRNGTYTAALLQQMNSPGVKIEEMFKAVRVSVRTATKDQQTPWESSSLVGAFCFAGDCGPNNGAKSSTTAGDPDEEFWLTVRTSSDPEDFRAYLKAFPNGRYVTVARNSLRRFEVVKNSERKESSASQGESIKETVRNSAGMEFQWIRSGSFMMGSENGNPDEKPVHRTTISKGFYIGRYEVTQEQWRTIMGGTLEQQRDKIDPSLQLPGEGPTYPMYYVSWDEAQEFTRRLNRMNDGYTYRLPTEAEWEYACRADTTGDYAGNLDSTTWYANNSGKAYLDAAQILRNDRNNYMARLHENGNQTHQVGTKQPNEFGLYDMQGNVWEWCQDWYSDSYYRKSPGVDPQGPASGQYRVMRGGAWAWDAVKSRSALRHWVTPNRRADIFGFRVIAIKGNSAASQLPTDTSTSSQTLDSSKQITTGSTASLRFDGLYYAPKPQRAGYIRLYPDGTFVGTGGSTFSADEFALSKERELPQGTYVVSGDRITFTYLKFATLTQHNGVIRKDGMQVTYPDGTTADYLFSTWSELKRNAVSTEQTASRVEQEAQSQKPIQTVNSNLYTFDLQQCRLSGTTIICDLVITNNDRDRKFSFDNIVNGAGMMDNFGAAYQATSLQIANRNGFDDAVIPSNVPIKSRVTFDNVSSQATRIVSLRMQFNRYDPGINNHFRIEFRDVPLSK